MKQFDINKDEVQTVIDWLEDPDTHQIAVHPTLDMNLCYVKDTLSELLELDGEVIQINITESDLDDMYERDLEQKQELDYLFKHGAEE